jgi:uncharacterized coiled-coil DUF342 family protein
MRERRAKEAERVAAEAEELREEVSALRLKCDGAVSRKRTVEAEVRGLKEKLSVLLQKTSNDDRLIGALRAEVAEARRAKGKAAHESGCGRHTLASKSCLPAAAFRLLGSRI